MITSGLGILISIPALGADSGQPIENANPRVVYGDAPPNYQPHTVPRTVLMEDNTNWGCGPCAGHNPAWTACIEANGYDIVAALIHAIRNVAFVENGTLYIPRGALVDAVRGLEGFEGLSGNISCDDVGECNTAGPTFYVVQDGAWVEAE